MKKWFVKLPDGGFTLESDTPGADLVAQGYTEFALTEIPPREPGAPLPDPSYQIPEWALSAAIEGLFELSLRLEIEASVYQQMNTHQGRLIADDRLERAELYRAAATFYGKL